MRLVHELHMPVRLLQGRTRAVESRILHADRRPLLTVQWIELDLGCGHLLREALHVQSVASLGLRSLLG